VTQVAQEEASAGAEAAKQQEAKGVVVGETSAAKTDEAAPAKTDEATTAKAGEADEHVAPNRTERAAAEAALTSPQLENQSGGHGEERKVHTISSDEPPRPHGKAVMDAEVSITAEMPPRCAKGQEVEGNLALVRFGAGPWTVTAPIFMGSPEEEEEAHWIVLEGFGNLAGRSLQTLLHILTEDLPHAVEVSPSFLSVRVPGTRSFLL
jgi:hypothetical protein